MIIGERVVISVFCFTSLRYLYNLGIGLFVGKVVKALGKERGKEIDRVIVCTQNKLFITSISSNYYLFCCFSYLKSLLFLLEHPTTRNLPSLLQIDFVLFFLLFCFRFYSKLCFFIILSPNSYIAPLINLSSLLAKTFSFSIFLSKTSILSCLSFNFCLHCCKAIRYLS